VSGLRLGDRDGRSAQSPFRPARARDDPERDDPGRAQGGHIAPPNPNIQQQGDNLIVYPTATYPTDRINVQWAVDNVSPNGTVFLKSVDLLGQPQYFHNIA
jgi:hypothetical protein